MSKALKLSIFTLALIGAGVVLSHGIIVPRFIWEPRLQAIQNQYPDQTIQAKRIVLAFSLNPQLMISEIEVDAPGRQENVRVGLVRFGVDALESIQQGRLQIKALTVKGLAVNANRQADCSNLTLTCVPVLPVALVARAWQSTQVANPGFLTPELNLEKLDIEQASFTVANSEAQQQITGKVEQLKFQTGRSAATNQFSLGWQINIKTPQENKQLYIAMNAQTEAGVPREIILKNLKVDVSGLWDSFPWTGTAEQDLLVLRIAQTNNGEGAPYLKLNGDNLRTYIRRDDLPETHQAAFSVQQFEGGLPAQDWALKKAEWTYTHEDAQAWTFNINYAASESLLEVQAETIEGSEGIPAEAQARELNCTADETKTRESRPYWAWQEGWFRVLGEHPLESANLVLCPIQQPSVGAGLDEAATSPSGDNAGK